MITLFQGIVIIFAVLLSTALIAGVVWAFLQTYETYIHLTNEAKALQLNTEDQEREHAQIL